MIKQIVFIVFCIGISFSEVALGHDDTDKDKFKVVLDAGHGGHDSGNRGGGYYEKDIALSIVLKVGAILEKKSDFEVIYTRKDDRFIELNKRADIANKAKADLFVSVHCNSHGSQAHGTETFALGLHRNESNFEIAKKENAVILLEDDYQNNYEGFDPNSPESIIGLTLMQEEYLEQSLTLASLIQNQFTKKLKRNNRGVKQAGFIVLYRTYMPSVLVETGFLTNKNEGPYLNSNKGQEDMAKSITNAVLQYRKALESNFDKIPEAVTEEVEEQITQTEQDTLAVPATKEEIVEKKPMEKIKTPLEIDYIPGEEPEEKESSEAIVEEDVQSDLPKPAGLLFKVQLAASSTEVDTTPENFHGLSNISKDRLGPLFKYYYSQATSYDAIQAKKEEAINAGYTSCFIAAFVDGESVPIQKALEIEKLNTSNPN